MLEHLRFEGECFRCQKRCHMAMDEEAPLQRET